MGYLIKMECSGSRKFVSVKSNTTLFYIFSFLSIHVTSAGTFGL